MKWRKYKIDNNIFWENIEENVVESHVYCKERQNRKGKN